MEGRVFALDILRDWSFGSTREAISKKHVSRESASIKKLARHYLKSGRAGSMDEACAMAAMILR